MIQPQWITPAGSLGVIPEGVFYSVPVQAQAGPEDVFFRLIAGRLPDGVTVNTNGVIEGIPRSTVRVQGVPSEVGEDITSQFAIRAYTVDPNGFIKRLADRTFTITVTGQDIPEFVTPAGNIGTFYDGTKVRLPVEFTDTDPGDQVRIRVLSGQLPPGLTIDPVTGIISGIILPLVGPPNTAQGGYDITAYAEYPYDFGTRSANTNYQFTLEITDGKQSNIRTFEIYVYAKSTMVADTTDISSDETFPTADVTPNHVPVLLNEPGFIGRYRADNWFAYKFDAIDFDGDPIEYSITVGAGIGFDSASVNAQPGSYDQGAFDRGTFSLPPGLSIDPDTGWFYGYIPDQGATEFTYEFAVRVFKRNDPTVISEYYYFTITITGDVETEVSWLTEPDLGSIDNGAISTLAVQAVNAGGRSLQYRIEPGSDSRLPQGLTLQSSGNITGRVSFNTFCLDSGITTFDAVPANLNIADETTFDSTYRFTVNAFAAETEQIGYQVSSIVITNGGSGYVTQPTITISAPPPTRGSIQATVGAITIVGGVITAVAVGNPGRGYVSPPAVIITGGGGVGASAVTRVIESQLTNAVSVFRRFVLTVRRAFNTPYEKLYVKCMPPQEDRDLIADLVQNQDLIPVDLVYRPDDPNFGVARNVIYDHAYGLYPASLDDYVSSLDINHYWKNVVLGEFTTAQALDADGNVLYELVYSPVVDDLVNDQGTSVGKEVELAYPVDYQDLDQVDVVYPNSLDNMRDQVIDTVGQISPALPLWMTSKQTNGRVLGFTPAWVIAYCRPGRSGQVLYNIQQNFGNTFNVVDFKIDRYEIDRSQTHDYDSSTGQWIPQPPQATTFDVYSEPSQVVPWFNDLILPIQWENDQDAAVVWQNTPSGIVQTGTVFDGGSTTFVTPADRWIATDIFDKYLLFPKANILK